MKTESLRFKILRELFFVRRSLTADALAERLNITSSAAEDGGSPWQMWPRCRVAWSLGWLVREGYAARALGRFEGLPGFYPLFKVTERGRDFFAGVVRARVTGREP